MPWPGRVGGRTRFVADPSVPLCTYARVDPSRLRLFPLLSCMKTTGYFILGPNLSPPPIQPRSSESHFIDFRIFPVRHFFRFQLAAGYSDSQRLFVRSSWRVLKSLPHALPLTIPPAPSRFDFLIIFIHFPFPLLPLEMTSCIGIHKVANVSIIRYRPSCWRA